MTTRSLKELSKLFTKQWNNIIYMTNLPQPPIQSVSEHMGMPYTQPLTPPPAMTPDELKAEEKKQEESANIANKKAEEKNKLN